MESMLGEDQTLPLNFDQSVNMSRFPDMSDLATPTKPVTEPHTSRQSDPGGMFFSPSVTSVGDRLSPGTSQNMKDFATQISELKKENFSLKLRIFYMEERMQEQFVDVDQEKLMRTNIELKVDCDSLRRELHEKNDLLIKASNAVACMESAGPAEVNRVRNDAAQEVSQLRELMNEKVGAAEKDLRAAQREAEECLEQAIEAKTELEEMKERNKLLIERLDATNKELELERENDDLAARLFVASESKEEDVPCDDEDKIKLERDLELLEGQVAQLKAELGDKDGTILQLKNSLTSKQTVIELLSSEKHAAVGQTEPLMKEVESLTAQLNELRAKLKQSRDEEEASKEAYQEMLDNRFRSDNEMQQLKRDLARQLREKDKQLDNLQTQLSDYDDTVSSLDAQIREKDEELAALANKHKALMVDVKDLKSKLGLSKARENASQKTYDELLQLQDDFQEHSIEQQQRLDEFELATKQMAAELEKREIEVKDLRDALSESEETARELTSKFRSEENRAKKDLNKRDRAIAGLTQLIRKKDEEIEKLNEEVKSMDEKQEEFLNAIRKLEVNKPQAFTKDTLITQLRNQLQESDTALQDALDNKLRSEDEVQKLKRDFGNRLREKDRLLESLQMRVDDYEETVASLDGKIKEKDEELQALMNKYKALLRDSKMKSEECQKVRQDRDELMRDCQEEKEKFLGLAKRRLRRSSGDTGSGSSLADSDSEQRVKTLADKLKLKDQALNDACNERDAAVLKLNSVRNELEEVLRSRAEETERNRRTVAHQDVRVHQLEELVKKKQDRINDLEDRLETEVERLTKLNNELQNKLKRCEDELKNLNKRQSNGKSRTDEADAVTRDNELTRLRDDVTVLRSQLDEKNALIKRLRKQHVTVNLDQSESSMSDSSSCSEEDGESYSYTYCYRPSGRKGKKSRKPSSKRARFHEDHFVATDNAEPSRKPNKTGYNRSIIAENKVTNGTMNSTLGFPLDQTSYMSMPDSYKGSNDGSNSSAKELEQVLEDTRTKLSAAVRDVADLNKTCTIQATMIEELQAVLRKRTQDNNDLAKQLELSAADKMAKESEVMGLLARMKDNQPKTGAEAAMNGHADSEDDESMSSIASRLRSGDKGDGMNTLSRKELCDVINNLKQKLSNAEKVNDLLKQQLQKKENAIEKPDHEATPHLVEELSAEVERLKAKLQKEQQRSQPDTETDSGLQSTVKKAPVSGLLPSKLPVLSDKVGAKPSGMSLYQELERSRMLNRKLKERLAATEQTVRQQADRLNKCRAALREAGIASPPSSPIRAARSVPDLYRAFDSIENGIDEFRRPGLERHRSSSADTTDASTQTTTGADSGFASGTPKSEPRHSSLIQSQAKELSQLRGQIKKSQEVAKQVETEMEILNRYIDSLLSSNNSIDPVLASGVKEEIEQSRNLVNKLRSRLADHSGDAYTSDTDYDGSTTPDTSSDQLHASQIKRLTDELNGRTRRINELEKRLQALTRAMETPDSLVATRPHSTDTYITGGKGQPLSSAAPSPSPRPVASEAYKKRRGSGNSGYKTFGDRQFLSPTSSHSSLHSANEDEMPVDDSSRAPTGFGDHDHRYASLPNLAENKQRFSWPVQEQMRKRIPMYQKTIAVTEYLPPGARNRKGQRSSECSGDERPRGGARRRLLTGASETECTASYGGAWGPISPRKNDAPSPTVSKHKTSLTNNHALVGASSCDDEVGYGDHKLAREVDRLRRRLSDSKRINRTLKEELDLATKSLHRAKDSMVPGYQRSPHRTSDMLAQHLSEIRGLRQRLEQSIATNDNLRVKLEKRLGKSDPNSSEHVAANIYVTGDDVDAPGKDDELRDRLSSAEAENSELRERLSAEESAHRDAVKEVTSLKQQLNEKFSQAGLFAQHVDQMEKELKQQSAFCERLGSELRTRDRHLEAARKQIGDAEAEKSDLCKALSDEKGTAKRLENEMAALSNELDQSHRLIDTLKSEIKLHEKLNRTRSDPDRSQSDHELDLSELLQEIRSLRTQLERSIDTNAALRRQLEEQLKGSSKGHDPVTTTINIHHLTPNRKSSRQNSPQNSARRKLRLEPFVEDDSTLMTPPASASSGPEEQSNLFFPFDPRAKRGSAKHAEEPLNPQDKPFYCDEGQFRICKSEDFDNLQKTLMDSNLLAQSADENLRRRVTSPAKRTSPDKKAAKDMAKAIAALRRHLGESEKLLLDFWPVDLQALREIAPEKRTTSYTSSGVATGGRCSCSSSEYRAPSIGQKRDLDESSSYSEAEGLRREVGKLRRRLSTQDRLLQSTVERLHSTNRLKEGIESAIVQQLSRTHNVLRKARGNLEANVQRPAVPQ